MRSVATLAGVVLGSIVGLCSALTAQSVFTRAMPYVASGTAVAYEPISGEGYVYNGAGGMWRFDEGLWTPITVAGAPTLASPLACTWPGHGMLVFGSGQTWLWNGTSWVRILTANVPPNVRAMAFDAVRQVVVAHVGSTTSGPQLWEFDGVDWLYRATTSLFPTTTYSAMAWDPVGQQCILRITNGQGATGYYSWNGSAWSLLSMGGAAGPVGASVATAPGQGGVLFSGGFSQPYYYGFTFLMSVAGYPALPTVGGPPPRYESASWYDSGRGRTVITALGGGYASNLGSWYWDGVTWSQPVAGRFAPYYFVQPITYDSWNGRALRFGGLHVPNQLHGELWEIRGLIATQLPGGPLARTAQGCAFDTWRGRLVVFGGVDYAPAGGPTVLYQDNGATHEWDGQTWASIPNTTVWAPGTDPRFRMSPALAFDRLRGKTVMFGGGNVNGGYSATWRNDTFEWDGAVWTPMQPAQSPPAAEGRMLFDPTIGQCVLYVANTVWSWDGTNWAQRTAPTPGAWAVLDESRGIWMRFGNQSVEELQNGVWQQVSTATVTNPVFSLAEGRFIGSDGRGAFAYGDPAAATLRPFGAGCAGTAGVPVLHGEDPPRLGLTMTLRLERLPTGAAWFGMLGADTPTWLGQPLPIDLAPLGAPGCTLLTAIDAYEVRNGAPWPISVPANLALLGNGFVLQAFVMDAAANALGATTSNGVKLRIGA